MTGQAETEHPFATWAKRPFTSDTGCETMIGQIEAVVLDLANCALSKPVVAVGVFRAQMAWRVTSG